MFCYKDSTVFFIFVVVVETEEIRDILLGAGLQDTVNYALSSSENHARLTPGRATTDTPFIELANPGVVERRVMRRSLLVSALEKAQYNLRHSDRLAMFELGRVYLPDKPITGSQGLVTFVKADSWLTTYNLGAVGPHNALAWSPYSKTVIRSGYGIYFDPLNSFMVTAVATGKIPGLVTSCSSTIGGSTTPGCVAAPDLRVDQGFPTELNPPTTKPSIPHAPGAAL